VVELWARVRWQKQSGAEGSRTLDLLNAMSRSTCEGQRKQPKTAGTPASRPSPLGSSRRSSGRCSPTEHHSRPPRRTTLPATRARLHGQPFRVRSRSAKVASRSPEPGITTIDSAGAARWGLSLETSRSWACVRKGGLEPPNTCGKAAEIPRGIGQDRARRGRFCPPGGHAGSPALRPSARGSPPGRVASRATARHADERLGALRAVL
jgi:hypothetical protein